MTRPRMMRRAPTGRLLRRACALAVPVALSAAGLMVVGPAVLPAAAAEPPRPRLKVTQIVDPTTYDKAGQVLTWTSLVTNFGNTSLGALEVTDSVAGVSERRCTPVAVGGTLAAGATTTCTATYAVSQADLDGDARTSDTVEASATTSEQQGAVKVSASATAVSAAKVSPGLALTVTASPTTVSLAGQQVAYTFMARNRGNQTLRDLLVTAPFPGLSALVCSPTLQGGTLAPGATTTCRATRLIAVTDLGAPLENSAKVEATTLIGKRVANSGAVSVATRALPPIVSSYVSAAVLGGRPISLPGATTARPGATGGAPIDVSRTVFVGFEPRSPWAGKLIGTRHASWAILPDGSVKVTPTLQYLGTGVDKVDYRVYDAAGRSTVGHLTVTLRAGASAGVLGTATTVQNHPVTVDVLGHDDPGLNADGTPSSFDRTSLRLVKLDFGPEGDWSRPAVNYLDEGRTINVVDVGDYTAGPDGVTFTPVPSFTGTPPPVGYAATSVTGSPDYNVWTVTVSKGTPAAAPTRVLTATDDHAVTLRHLGAHLAGQGNDFGGAPDKGTFPSDQLAHLPAGSRLLGPTELFVAGEGTYEILGLGPQGISFSPVAAFVGPTTTPVQYQIENNEGQTARGTLTVTVQGGADARPDTVTTAQNRPVNVDVTTNDVLGPSLDGAPLTQAAYSPPLFAESGQPTGSKLDPFDNTLSVPGEGFYTVNPANGTITFDPVSRFTGVASPVRVTTQVNVPVPFSNPGDLALEQPTSTLQVTVTATVPVAHPDTASTGVGQPVVIRALANDVAGSTAVPLVGSSIRLRLAAGLPSGSTLSGDAKLLTVAGRGGVPRGRERRDHLRAARDQDRRRAGDRLPGRRRQRDHHALDPGGHGPLRTTASMTRARTGLSQRGQCCRQRTPEVHPPDWGRWGRRHLMRLVGTRETTSPS